MDELVTHANAQGAGDYLVIRRLAHLKHLVRGVVILIGIRQPIGEMRAALGLLLNENGSPQILKVGLTRYGFSPRSLFGAN